MNPDQQPAQPTPSTEPVGWSPTLQNQPVAPSAYAAQPVQPTPVNDVLGANYLDQIAPSEQKTVNRFALFGLIGGILVLVLVLFSIMSNSGGPDTSSQIRGINARIVTLQTVTNAQQKHLNENAISEANTTISSVLTSMNTGLTEIMKTKAIKASDSKSKSSATEKTYAAALTKKLDDAYQRGTLDRVYAPQMVYELTILRSKLVTLKKASQSTSVVTFCDTSLKDIDAALKAFTSFSSTK